MGLSLPPHAWFIKVQVATGTHPAPSPQGVFLNECLFSIVSARHYQTLKASFGCTDSHSLNGGVGEEASTGPPQN